MCCSIMCPPCEVGASKSKHEGMELNNKFRIKNDAHSYKKTELSDFSMTQTGLGAGGA